MKWDEVFDKRTGIVDDEKARRVLNISTSVAQITADELENGVTLEKLSTIGVPVFRYQTQVTIHGRLPDFNPETRPGGYKAVFKNGNGSIGVKYCAVDLPKKLALTEATGFTHKVRGWYAHRDSTGFQLQRGFEGDREAAETCLREVPRDLFIGSAYGCRHPWTGAFYVVVEVAAVPVEHLWRLVEWFTGIATEGQLAVFKAAADAKRAEERAQWDAEEAERQKQREIERAKKLETAKGYAAGLSVQPLKAVPVIGKFRRVLVREDGQAFLRVVEIAKRGACLCFKAENMDKWCKVGEAARERWEASCRDGLLFPMEDTPRSIAVTVPVQSVGGITVTENLEKNGVEIRFPSKPAESVLTDLKARGWRWSRFNNCWYNRRTDEALQYAHSIAGEVPVAA